MHHTQILYPVNIIIANIGNQIKTICYHNNHYIFIKPMVIGHLNDIKHTNTGVHYCITHCYVTTHIPYFSMCSRPALPKICGVKGVRSIPRVSITSWACLSIGLVRSAYCTCTRNNRVHWINILPDRVLFIYY